MISIDDFKKIRTERHLIVLDTNILLELYRQPANISLDVIEALKQVIGDLFIPRQVYDEYLRNYQAVCGGEKKKYQRVSKELLESTRKLQDDILTKITEYRKHNYTDISQLQSNLDDKISNIYDIIKTFEKEHQAEKQLSLDFLNNDRVKEFVDFLDSNGKIEEPLKFSKKLSILQEGKVRFDNCIPPGYMDCEKEGADKYGDLFVWKSILKVAKEKNVHVIFVCNDIKEDWWDKDGEIPIELRTELLDEFKEYNPFLNIYFVTLDRFFSYLSEELHIGNSKSALQLSAMDDARLLVDDYNEEIDIKIGEFLQAMDIVKEIDEEFIEVGDEETYWEIESVSIEKEGKTITYYCKSTHNRRERPVCGHRGRSRGPFYYRITTFGKGPWDARDPHKTTFMALKHVIRLSIWQRQKETPGVEKAPGVSSPQRKESGRSGRDDGELRFGYDPAIHARRLRVYHRPRRLRMASRISIFFAARRFEPLNSMG